MRARSLIWRGLTVLAVGIRTCPKLFAVSALAAAIYGGMVVVASYVLGRVTDHVILPALQRGAVTQASLAAAAGAIVAVAVIKAGGVFGRRYGAYAMQFRLQAIFRARVTSRYLELPVAWHRRHTTGELLSTAHSDIESAWWTVAPLPMAVGGAVMFAVTAVILVVTDVFLAAVGLVAGPALALLNWRYQRRMGEVAAEAQQLRAATAERAHESFDAALVVKTLGREGAETASFRNRSEDLRDRMMTIGRIRAWFDPAIEALPDLAILLVLGVGTWRVSRGFLSAGDLVLFAYLFRLLALPSRVIGWMLGLMPSSVVGWDRVERILVAPGAPEQGNLRPAGVGPAALRSRQVSFQHPAAAAKRPTRSGVAARGDETGGVRDVTLEVPPGRMLAIVGSIGSGKSTIAALFVRLFDPDAGALLLDGTDLRDLDPKALSDDVAIVFQDSFLWDDTIYENIALGTDATAEQVREAAWVACADGFIEALDDGYATRIGERGATLSGGQRQRIALARALIRRPRLLVLDDATSSVDPAVEAAILDRLSATDLVSTVVVIAYRRSVITLADEVVYVEDGTIRARGTHAQLMATTPDYARLVSSYDDPASILTGGNAAERTTFRQARA
ncbi:MAG: ABC transporter ATP-binding protein/permease [Actinomycetota bacterium]|nr:ABC transporter ATP-binding protein/permease [Actinomycetota bacterium]